MCAVSDVPLIKPVFKLPCSVSTVFALVSQSFVILLLLFLPCCVGVCCTSFAIFRLFSLFVLLLLLLLLSFLMLIL